MVRRDLHFTIEDWDALHYDLRHIYLKGLMLLQYHERVEGIVDTMTGTRGGEMPQPPFKGDVDPDDDDALTDLGATFNVRRV